MRLFLLFISSLLLLTACNEDKQAVVPIKPPPAVGEGLPIPDNRYVDSYQILLVGNSHVRSYDLSGFLKSLLQSGTGKSAIITIAPGGGYLDSRLNDGVTKETVRSGQWSHIIWQAQKYSTTGNYTYPTTAAEYWIELTKQHSATPILFPEHPREGNKEEGMRIYKLHIDISSRAAACVAPIGPAWNLAIKSLPNVDFYLDGNHASINGAFLTALVFYQVITGESVENLSYIPQIEVTESLQAELRQVVSATFQQFSNCIY